MRLKDELKREAVIKATISIVNEIGFAYASVSKIAKKAGVSPATIYVYFKNKEDLLVSVFLEIKKYFAVFIFKDFNPVHPVRDILENIWYRAFDYVSNHNEEFQFKEQFSNSPYSDLLNAENENVQKYFAPLTMTIERGIKEKIIKNADYDILIAFIFYPVMILANSRVCSNFKITGKGVKESFEMAWDAIKL